MTCLKTPVRVLFILSVCFSCASGWFFSWGRKVCYNLYGCFDNKKPFTNTNKVPVEPAKIELQLLLNTQANPDPSNAVSLSPTDTTQIKNSDYNSSLPVVLIIHGLKDKATNYWVKDIASEILQVENKNVIRVDWRGGADTNYAQATANTRLVGKMVAVFLKYIHSIFGTSYANMHIIGHSLGAHTAGYVGEDISGLGRITGLDPAGYRFEKYDPVVRLDPSDANFVDVMHTDSDELLELGWGTDKPMGDVDFFPNGGEDQPGCKKSFISYMVLVLQLKFTEVRDQIACSHMRAVDLFISSIRDCKPKFIGYKCSSYKEYLKGTCSSDTATMGYWTNPASLHGNYYLKTTGNKPFC